jgi:MFS family permease
MTIKLPQKIDQGIRIITWATGVRWFGWGLFETLFPVFLFSFSGSFAETGFFKSIYYIFFLLAAPIAGLLADRIRATHVIILALCVYPFIGLSYFLAGFFGVSIFIVIARALNGAAYAFDVIGRHTYVRRHVAPEHVGRTFGVRILRCDYLRHVDHCGDYRSRTRKKIRDIRIDTRDHSYDAYHNFYDRINP